jgi:Na+-transporting methylmalonyl-CoA/oxaloacetate decarboxylase gamma subunit
MKNQDEYDNKTDQPELINDSDIIGNIKTLLLTISGLAVVLSILILLPMFLTYLSEGDSRAPSEIHPTDRARKNGQNNYNIVKPE